MKKVFITALALLMGTFMYAQRDMSKTLGSSPSKGVKTELRMSVNPTPTRANSTRTTRSDSELTYCTAAYSSSIGTGTPGSYYEWAAVFRPGQYTADDIYLTSVDFYSYEPATYTVSIYEGNADAAVPTDLIYQYQYNVTESLEWVNLPINNAVVEIDHSKALWVALGTDQGTYPAAYSNEILGTTDCCMMYFQSEWMPITELGPFNIQPWMIVANTTNGNPPTPVPTGNLHVVDAEGNVDVINMGPRPSGAWMRPYAFTMTYEGEAPAAVSRLDFTPNDGFFTMVGVEYPINFNNGDEVELAIATGETTETSIDRQFVAIYDGSRLAKVWPITAEVYTPECPDMWEVARVINDAYPFEYRDTPTTTELHDNYLLPGNLQDGPDAVYKVTFDQDVLLNGTVTKSGHNDRAENGKMAIYTEGFNGVGGPDVNNNYTGPMSAGPGAEPYDVIVGEGTDQINFVPLYCYFNYRVSEQLYLASELQAAGMSAGPINTIGFNNVTSNTHNATAIKIWMGNVTDVALTSTSMDLSSMTLVFDGGHQVTSEWNDFELNGAFSWDGTSNLVVIFQDNTGSYTSNYPKWAVTYCDTYMGAYDYSDYSSFNLEAGPVYLSTTRYRANTHFVGGGRNRDGNVLTYDFEDGLQGWTSIDADGDGRGWMTISDYCYGIAHTGSNGAVSASYDMCGTAGYIAFNANNYLVSPQKYAISEGSKLNFWFDDAALTYYVPDYFEVCVSTAGNTSASDFTAVWNSGRTSSNGTRDGRGTRSYGTWREVEVDLSAYAGQEIYIAFHHQQSDGYDLWIDDVTIDLGGSEPEPELTYIIENMTMVPGTYYIAASSTEDAWDVVLNASELPCPEMAYNPSPADDADELEPASVNLNWNLGEYTTEYRLVFGSTYYCEEVLVDWTTNLALSFTVSGLYNNTNYFWRVDERNGNCETLGQVWGFTTHLNVPRNLTVADEAIFEGENAVLSWNAIQDRTYRRYNIYQDGELIGSTPVNQVVTTYTVEGLTYNMDEGYRFQVSAVYDEGESALSEPVYVFVSGEGSVAGHVYEQDSITGIANAIITFTGTDEFGDDQTISFITDANGAFGGEILAGEYDAVATCEGYQTVTEPICGNPIAINFDETTSPVDFVMDENFTPVCQVVAQHYPDSLSLESEYIKVYWGCGLPGGDIIEDFETGDFTNFDWQLDGTYPWTITTNNPYEGDYCMKSGGAGVANVTSNMSVTVDIPNDGEISFFVKPSCESSYDKGHFYIDGTEKGTYTGQGSWSEKVYPVTAGEHTFKWSYTKDGSVNSNDDCVYVDYITFFRPTPPPVPGMTYDFDNSTMQGWTTIDADGDGYNWVLGSSLFSGSGLGHNASADMVSSQSFDNPTFTALHPDNYLVSPLVELGGIVKFYACAQDESYAAEHFGVAVSTTGNTNAADFTTLQEWTLSAKKGDMPRRPRNDGTRDSRDQRQGNWYEYTLDMSAYAGQTGYVAIRHFDCSDEFVLNVDDITIEEPGRAAANDRAFSHYRVYRTNCYNDGPYTLENTRVLACELQDTLYIDVEWDTLSPGVYKWGVGTVYSGNRDDLQEPRESEIVWSNCIDKDMYLEGDVTVNVLLNSADNPEGATVTFTNLNEVEQELYPIDPVVIDESGFYAFESFRKGEYAITVTMPGYVTIEEQRSIWSATDLRYVMTEIIYPAKNLYVSSTGWAMWEPTTPERSGDDRHLESFKVMCTSIDGQPIFNADTENPFCQVDTDELVEGEHYICKVAAIYSTGMSDWIECEWAYSACDNYAGTVDGVGEEDGTNGNHFSWTYPGTPGPVPPGPGDEFFEGFENGFPAGWSTIDADGDGFNWELASVLMAGYLIPAHGGVDCISSQSYDASAGALTPDNYLVTPQVAITNGSTFSFWACAQDPSYAAEHFGVAVSTDGTNFTTIEEWTMTAKEAAAEGAYMSKNGKGTREGNWYQKSVDLSEYAGQQLYIAIRHFDCSDWFYLNVDDVELAINGAKSGSNRAMWDLITSFSLTSAGQQGIASDGEYIYTCSWQAAPTGGYTFYKYDLDGNFIEGFDIAGATGIRDLTYDGQYFYGTSGASNIFILDLANQAFIGSINSPGLTSRHISYDPQNDGFWVGNWSDLKLIDRNGATVTTAPAPTSAYGSGYFETEDGDAHLYLFCQPSSDAKVYDYNITTNTMGSTPVLDFSMVPNFNAGISGGAFVGSYNGRIAFFGNAQQDPNLVGIFELGSIPGPVPPTPEGDILGAMIFRDGEWIAQVDYPTSEYIDTDEYGDHLYCVRLIYDGTNTLPEGNIYYSMSCPECIEIGSGSCPAGADIRGEYVWNEGGEFGALVSWGNNTPVPPTGDTEFTEGFEGGLNGWNVLNASGDASWIHSDDNLGGYDYTALAHTGTGFAMGYSFVDYVGAFNIDSYLYTPQKYDIVDGSTLTFWADNANDSYPENFSVCVATADNPTAADFTQVWAGGAKAGNAEKAAVRHDVNRYENWRQHTIDLSAYAGQSVYIAFHDVNYDMYEIWIDDVQLTAGAKNGNRAELVSYNVYRSIDNVDYELIANVPAVEGQEYYEYFDEVAAGTYYYQVTALYADGCESDPALAENDHPNDFVTVVVTGVVENNGIALYPNPTSGMVKIEAAGMNHITVVSALGQIVYDAEVSCDEYELNMAQFNAGIYMVRISSESGVSTQRVTVVR